MSKKRELFRLIERDCVNSGTEDMIKDYINKLIKQNQALMFRKRRNVK